MGRVNEWNKTRAAWRQKRGKTTLLKRRSRPSMAAKFQGPHPERRLPFTQSLYSRGLIIE